MYINSYNMRPLNSEYHSFYEKVYLKYVYLPIIIGIHLHFIGKHIPWGLYHILRAWYNRRSRTKGAYLYFRLLRPGFRNFHKVPVKKTPLCTPYYCTKNLVLLSEKYLCFFFYKTFLKIAKPRSGSFL
uniref:Uncharacterized protein n=1 Tax=Cacopsylla melanoneura TaxID=428564 RepID=A0A8D8TL49_9HEMI